jgi:sugar phosphate isomerase/epimerase
MVPGISTVPQYGASTGTISHSGSDSLHSRHTLLMPWRLAMPAVELSRRSLLAAGIASAASLLPSRFFGADAPRLSYPVCVFVKFLQSLSFDDLAQTVADLGFQGIEATVRKKGQILPEQAVDELPRLVEALRARGLEITIMASSINRADDPLTEKVLRTAAGLGIKRYRMDYYRYDLSRPVLQQVREIKPIMRDLAAMNREIGIQAVYQNHAGPTFVGAPVWDLVELLDGIPREQIGIAFDVRHATVEGGLDWPVSWNLVQPHLAAVYIKNAHWAGRHLEDGPLADPKGVVDLNFFKMLKKSDFNGPVSLHVEYLERAGVAENIAAIRADFGTLKTLLGTKPA